MTSNRWSVLFVCVSNRGKSVMAEGLARAFAANMLDPSSAGTEAKLGVAPNAQSVQVLDEVNVDVSEHRPSQLTDEMMRAADLVVVIGTSAHVSAPEGVALEVWDTDEPSLRGIDGMDRMRLIRDDITTRIRDLVERIGQ